MPLILHRVKWMIRLFEFLLQQLFYVKGTPFFAYFQFIYALCPSVYAATTFHEVGRFLTQSIAYNSKTWTKEGFFGLSKPPPPDFNS
jgi:hypothetical protein